MRDLPDSIPDLALYRQMLRIRMVEEAIADRYSDQLMRCPVHLSIGQEAIAVGVCAALDRQDKTFSTHRCHAHYLAKGGDLGAMLAEIHGKATGCCAGRGGSMHLFDKAAGHALSLPIVGSVIPIAAGDALANKLNGSKAVSVVFVGDASLEEGVFHETANFAKVHNLRLLFICENNLFSVYTPLDERQPSDDLTRLATAHQIPCARHDGNNPGLVMNATRNMIEKMDDLPGPAFLQFDAYRIREHCGPAFDDDLGYRTADAITAGMKTEPLATGLAKLTEQGQLTEDMVHHMRAEIGEEIDGAFEAALSAPFPPSETVRDHVYAS